MAKKKHRNLPGKPTTANSIEKKTIIKKVATQTKTSVQKQKQPSYLLLVPAVAIITWLFFNTCLHNQFTNWDDPGYVKENPVIKDLSSQGIKNIFSLPVMGNYHPFTILSYAIEYNLFGLDPWIYHFDNLLLHVMVTLLVYFFVNQLTRQRLAAFITALLFGLHPMHVESVAWIAGRKDMMYSIFYIAALITYVNYIRNLNGKKTTWYVLTVLFFIFSLLGKPVAVALPVTLLLLDYFEKRKMNFQLLVEKIPLFLIAVGFGIKSVIEQHSIGALETKSTGFNFPERIALGCYALITYLWKAIIPAGLSCMYPYPQKPNGQLPLTFYVYPIAVLALVFIIWKFARKNRVVLFGSLFFLVNIALLLQFIPVGGAILADRYTYIPYLGLFIIAGWYASEYAGKKITYRFAPLTMLIAYSLLLGIISNQRCKVWYDTVSLWNDEIEKHPDYPEAYNNLGFFYFDKLNVTGNVTERKVYYDSAYLLLNKAVALKPDFAKALVSIGELQRIGGKLEEAKTYYYKALAINEQQGNANAYLSLGITYAMSNALDSAGKYFRLAIQTQHQYPQAHNSYGNYFAMTGKADSAIKEYSLAIQQNPDMFDAYFNRARLLQQLNRCNEAMNDFQRAIQIMPERADTYYARSYCYTSQGNKFLALQDVEKAISLGMTNIDNNYYQSLKAK